MPGVDVLADQQFRLLGGRRVGLLTHDAARNRRGEPTWSVLHRAPQVNLVALFAPEHGLDGKTPASAIVEDQRHKPTGLPLYSLYGRTRRPTREMLDKIGVMVVDLQDIGSRSYTFAAAMRETLEACLAAEKPVVILDRPNPLGGLKVDGPMVDPEWRSYVSAFPVPYVHGLTMGELARFALEKPGALDLNEERRTKAQLIVVPMRGWTRNMRWPDTGLRWFPTSPYVREFSAVEGYPITGLGCMIGGFKHGVGNDDPFRGLSFPGMRADDLIKQLTALGIHGLSFQKVEPLAANGRKLEGVFVQIDDWDALRPTELSFHLMKLACLWAKRNPFTAATADEKQSFNRHVGSTAWWKAVTTEGGRVSVRRFVDGWEAQARAFQQRSRSIWLYPYDVDEPKAEAPAKESEHAAATEG